MTVSKGKLKSITFYRPDGRKRIQIDLDHPHHGEQPHKHIGYKHGMDGVITKSDRLLIKRIENIWKEYTNQ